MNRTVSRIAALLAAFLLVAFVVFVINQTAQLVALAGRAAEEETISEADAEQYAAPTVLPPHGTIERLLRWRRSVP